MVVGTGWPSRELDLILPMTIALMGGALGMGYGSRFFMVLSELRGLVLKITTGKITSPDLLDNDLVTDFHNKSYFNTIISAL